MKNRYVPTTKLRVNQIGRDTSPLDLQKLFEKFGAVKEISIHMGGFLVYGLVEMTYDDAERAMDQINDWCSEGGRLRGHKLNVEMANRSVKQFLSPDWKPPRREPWQVKRFGY